MAMNFKTAWKKFEAWAKGFMEQNGGDALTFDDRAMYEAYDQIGAIIDGSVAVARSYAPRACDIAGKLLQGFSFKAAADLNEAGLWAVKRPRVKRKTKLSLRKTKRVVEKKRRRRT